MMSGLLLLLVLGVLQLAFALHVRNTVVDAASEGARYAALADNDPAAGVRRTGELLTTAIGPGYATDISSREIRLDGVPVIEVSVRTPLPLIGPIGLDGGLEATGHAVREMLAE
jgi:hypothetical protein